MKKISFFILLTVAFFACKKNTVYEKYIAFDDNIWNLNDTAVFEFKAPDTGFYDIYINIRHSSVYPYKNLWLFIDILAPNGIKETDTVNIFLAEDNGMWKGEGLGDLWDYKYLFRKNVGFLPGNYKIKIVQGMRDVDDVPVIECGLIIEKFKTNGEK